jgi:hypothetical protein
MSCEKGFRALIKKLTGIFTPEWLSKFDDIDLAKLNFLPDSWTKNLISKPTTLQGVLDVVDKLNLKEYELTAEDRAILTKVVFDHANWQKILKDKDTLQKVLDKFNLLHISDLGGIPELVAGKVVKVNNDGSGFIFVDAENALNVDFSGIQGEVETNPKLVQYIERKSTKRVESISDLLSLPEYFRNTIVVVTDAQGDNDTFKYTLGLADVEGLVYGGWERQDVEYLKVQWYNIFPNTNAVDVTLIDTMIDIAVEKKLDVVYGEGTYTINQDRFLRRNNVSNPSTETPRKSYNNITIRGQGIGKTILKGISTGGMDMFNLNFTEDLHFRDLTVTAEITNLVSQGTNGFSITGSAKNITIKNCECKDLPFADNGTYLDGGKAYSLQPGVIPCVYEDIIIEDNKAINCVYGASWDGNGEAQRTQPLKNIKIKNNYSKDCYRGLSFGYSSTGTEIPIDGLDIEIKGNTAIDCQQNVIGYATAIKFTDNTILTNTVARFMKANDTEVFGLRLSACFNMNTILGNIVKVEDGIAALIYGGTLSATGATIKYSNHNTFTANTFLCKNPSSGFDIQALNAGGNTAKNTQFIGNTYNTIDPLLRGPQNNNVFIDKNLNLQRSLRVNTAGEHDHATIVAPDMIINGEMGFAWSDEKNSYNTLSRSPMGGIVATNRSSSAVVPVLGATDKDGNMKIAFRSDGRLNMTTDVVNSTTLAKFDNPNKITHIQYVYDISGTVTGMIPVYGM